MAHPIDFYFDFSCPYAYLGSTQLSAIAAETGAEIRLRPFLLGGVFLHLGQAQNMSTTLNAPKKRHNRNDLIRWAALFDVPLNKPFRHPNRTVEALRVFLASPDDSKADVMAALYRLYWQDSADISDPDLLCDALNGLGLDGPSIVAKSRTPAIKKALFACTDNAIDAGVFGAPAWVVDGELFWGQDRIEMVKRATRGWKPTEQQRAFDFNQDA